MKNDYTSREVQIIPSEYRRHALFCGNIADNDNSTFLRVSKDAAAGLLAIPKYKAQPTEFLAERAQAHLVRIGRASIVNLVANPDRVTAIAVLEGLR